MLIHIVCWCRICCQYFWFLRLFLYWVLLLFALFFMFIISIFVIFFSVMVLFISSIWPLAISIFQKQDREEFYLLLINSGLLLSLLDLWRLLVILFQLQGGELNSHWDLLYSLMLLFRSTCCKCSCLRCLLRLWEGIYLNLNYLHLDLLLFKVEV